MAAYLEKDTVLVLVRNIPPDCHSSDLRNFFSTLVERDAFTCFHFRHRPEKLEDSTEAEKPTQGSKSMPVKTVSCFVNVRTEFAKEFMRFNGQNWTSERSGLLPTRCHIIRVKLSGLEAREDHGKAVDKSQATSVVNMGFLTRQERKIEQRYHLSHCNLQISDVNDMIEMNPPLLMPQGNVGTPTKHFLDLIQKCQMPASLIAKLGLRFPKGRRNRKYGQVGLDYGGAVSRSDGTSEEEDEVEAESEGFSWFDKKTRDIDDPEDVVPVEDRDDQDNDECEEWERHEALNDDVTTHERNKERLFEDEEEVVWEKGGPGVVWNMDANFWKEQAGGDDLDEATDDWDVDMSVYYEDEKDRPGDKDSRDFLQMRREKQMRSGTAPSLFRKRDTSRNTSPSSKTGAIGSFEKHTRGIGRKLLERKGWKEGKGVGKWKEGIADALESEGQQPYSKRGLGFYGKELVRHPRKRKQDFSQICQDAMLEPGQSGIRITTIFDQHDEGDSLKRRVLPTNLRYHLNEKS